MIHGGRTFSYEPKSTDDPQRRKACVIHHHGALHFGCRPESRFIAQLRSNPRQTQGGLVREQPGRGGRVIFRLKGRMQEADGRLTRYRKRMLGLARLWILGVLRLTLRGATVPSALKRWRSLILGIALGLHEDAMRSPCNGVADLDLRDFVRAHVRGTGPPRLVYSARADSCYLILLRKCHSVSELPNSEFSSQRFRLASLTRAVASSSHLRRAMLPQ